MTEEVQTINSQDLILKIQRAAFVLGGLAIVASAITLDPNFVVGVFVGAAIGWANLAIIRALYERGRENPDYRHMVIGAVAVKVVLLLIMITVLILAFNLNGTAFIAGFSSMVLAVLAVPMRFLLFPKAASRISAEGTDPGGEVGG